MHLLSILAVAAAWLALEACRTAPQPVAAATPCPNLTAPRIVRNSGRTALEIRLKMDVDVDGAPNAYGPKGMKALDTLDHALAPAVPGQPQEIVGYMTEYDGGPPTIQRQDDPYPGYYVSQTDFADIHNPRMEDPRRYVDASRINYVVLGDAGMKAGVKMGDFAVAYSCRTGKSAYAIVGDSGNPSGAEGSLALVRALGYTDIVNGIEKSVEHPEIVIRYFPDSNPAHQVFKSQPELDRAAEGLGLGK